ncbi:MAG: ATP-binding protein [Oscillospiraceae bacterium]|nr:ATP-binding protein [Oscillospiraceae bacterium]
MEPKALEIQNRFSLLAAEGRFPHGVLLEGGDSRSLLALSKKLAMTAVCTDPQHKPCGKCPCCKKAKGNNHPDVITVVESDPKRKTISVDLMRWLREDAIVKPNEADKKVYQIPRADTMTREAQNALLKLLEEPPDYAVFLLLCQNSAAMLPTIRSRVQTYSLETQPALTTSASDLAAAMAMAIPVSEAELLLSAAPLVKGKDREKFGDVLCALELLFRDCCVLKAGGRTILSGREDCVRFLCKKLSHRQCVQLLAQVQQTQSENERNGNLALLVTCLCAHLRQTASGASR